VTQLVPPAVVTETLQVPAFAPPPVVQVSWENDTTCTPVQATAGVPAPWLIATVAPEMNPLPSIVSCVPPAAGPEEGLTAVTFVCGP
jgi:hypothetical protein